ncbi:MAG TPA: hypothetical protein VHV55_23565 [Pirellulales bacterium]|nr:hypothetical protein [Pirellulales bacterium]
MEKTLLPELPLAELPDEELLSPLEVVPELLLAAGAKPELEAAPVRAVPPVVEPVVEPLVVPLPALPLAAEFAAPPVCEPAPLLPGWTPVRPAAPPIPRMLALLAPPVWPPAVRVWPPATPA